MLRNLLIACGFLIAFGLGWIMSNGPFTSGATMARADANQGEQPGVKGWTKGKGWGPWGKDDEVGSLNAMTAATMKAALGLVKEGKVYDLGINYDMESYKWPGHSPGAIMTFRGPEGIRRQGDFKAAADLKLNPEKIGWHSCAMFMSDNVATQIDGLGHITEGDDNHWYNGFKEADWGGNFGIRKCDSTTIPPIITRGVMIDVAAFRKVEALPSNYRITINDLEAALKEQKTTLMVGDTVMIRTGTCKFWGANGGDHKKIGSHDSAGIDLAAARWLVEQKGAILVGSDTSGLEWGPGPEEKATGFIPVHRYLLIQQGVHIGEFHNLEELARDRVYEFCYVCMTNRIRGTVAGFALRPIAIR